MACSSNLAWIAGFQNKYLSRVVAERRRRRLQRRLLSIKSADHVSLAGAGRGRTAWSRAFIFANAGRNARRSTRTRGSLTQRRRIYPFQIRLQSLRKSKACRKALAMEPCKTVGDEERGVERRIETLRTLVPESRGLDTPILLEVVAEYIMVLKFQVESMQALANCLENSVSKDSCSVRL